MIRGAILALFAAFVCASPGGGGSDAKLKRPRLEVKALPRFAFSPASILLIADLQGGDDIEEYYCPEVEWDWDDGGKSVHESDCPPYAAGTKIDRRFTEAHEYRRAGSYSVKLTLRHGNRSLVTGNVKVTVRPGLGDPSQ